MDRRDFLKACAVGSTCASMPFLASSTVAAINSPVIWSGVTYLAHNEGRLKHARAALGKQVPSSGGSVNFSFTQSLAKILPSLNQMNLVLDPETLDPQARPEYGFTLALAQEVIGRADQSEGSSRYNCLLVGYGFIYHLYEKRVEFSFPVRVQNTGAIDGPLDLDSVFVDLMAGSPEQGLSGMNQYLASLVQKQKFEIRDQNQWRFQVVTPLEKERLANDTAQMGINKTEFLDWIGFSVTDAFSSRLGVPVSPFRDSRATGVDMVVRFPTGSETLAMEIPTPDYEIVPLIRGWAVQKQPRADGSGIEAVSIIAGLNLNVRFAGDTDSFFAQRFRMKLDYLERPGATFDPLLWVSSMYEVLLTDLFDAVAGDEIAYKRLVNAESVERGGAGTRITVALHGDDVERFDSEISRLKSELPS